MYKRQIIDALGSLTVLESGTTLHLWGILANLSLYRNGSVRRHIYLLFRVFNRSLSETAAKLDRFIFNCTTCTSSSIVKHEAPPPTAIRANSNENNNLFKQLGIKVTWIFICFLPSPISHVYPSFYINHSPFIII